MKSITDLTHGKTTQQLVASGQQQTANSQTSNSDRARAAILILWKTMSSMYGLKWVSSFGADADPDGVWQAVITGLTPQQVQQGVEECRRLCLEWPPSAPQFRALCLGKDARNVDDEGNDASWQHRAHAHAAAVTDKYLADNRLRLTDQNRQERTKKAGSATLNLLRGMFQGGGQ